MASTRDAFSSRFGFVMAASGSAVGLGNIWGFPTQAASNGGGAFLLVYLVLAFTLAYPALMAEIIIGRYAHANAVSALRQISRNRISANIGAVSGMTGIVVAGLILSFYAIVAGWIIAFCLSSLATVSSMPAMTDWLTSFSLPRNLLFASVFMALTIAIVSLGVRAGIERWSQRLMPALVVILIILTGYVLTLDGANEGLRLYLQPDFARALSPQLIINALGAAFFSLSLGVGTMLIYGSYISDEENLPFIGGLVTLIDVAIAVLAGFLILPAMYVALHNGVEIVTVKGTLISEDTLIFTVLPQLFTTLGPAGSLLSFIFFFLMTIAALTSAISMLEAPVAYVMEEHGMRRSATAIAVGSMITGVSIVIMLNFETLFGLVVAVTTRYSQPLLGFVFCIYAGWVWHRDTVLQELSKGFPRVNHSLFWKIWPWYVRLVCPAVILGIFAQSFWA